MDLEELNKFSIPKPKEREAVNFSIDKELFEAVKKDLRLRKIRIREVIEWALKIYLIKSNPKEAERLGLF